MTRTIAASDTDLADLFGVADGIEAVRQRVRQRLLLYRGESFLDAESGIPYLQGILGERLPRALAAVLIADEIRKVAGVESVVNVDTSFDPQTRRLSVVATVITDDSTITTEVEL